MLTAPARLQLVSKLDALYTADDYRAMAELLEAQESLDAGLALYLARALINEFNRVGGEMLLLRANEALDLFADERHDDPEWLYLKAYVLVKQQLHEDALIRLERAASRVGINDHALFERIAALKAVCETALKDPALKAEDVKLYDDHLRRHFGDMEFVEERSGVTVLKCTAHENFNLLLTKGLLGVEMPVPAGVDPYENAHLELALCLRKEWPLDDDDLKYRWPVNLLFDLAAFIRQGKTFVGFGYTFDLGRRAHPLSCFTGGMLTALGAFNREAQEFSLASGEKVHLFEVIPLCPMEVAYRSSHHALDLLELFKNKRLVISPLTEGRPDAVAELNKINA